MHHSLSRGHLASTKSRYLHCWTVQQASSRMHRRASTHPVPFLSTREQQGTGRGKPFFQFMFITIEHCKVTTFSMEPPRLVRLASHCAHRPHHTQFCSAELRAALTTKHHLTNFKTLNIPLRHNEHNGGQEGNQGHLLREA